jgi:peptidoglycan hydrolase CwlO-like protein
MKRKIAISLIIVFMVFSAITFILTKIYNNKYNVLIDYVNPKIKNTKEEIKSNTNKLNEINEKNDSKQKAQDNMNKYIGELENRIKTYEK